MLKLFKNHMVILVTIFSLLYLIPVDQRLLWQPDETRYAEISREMLERGNWVVPYFLDIRYFEKPIAGYWINNIGQWLFGHHNFSVRFGSIFSTALTACLIFCLSIRLFHNRTTATIATLVYLTFFLVFSVGSYAVLDPMLSLWLAAAMVSFYGTLDAKSTRQKFIAYVLLGIACGMGFMTKGFLALAIPVISVLPIMVQQKRLKELFCFGPIALLSAFLLSLPWVLAIAHHEPDFWHYFFWVEHIQRFAEDNAQHKEPFWYYLPIFCIAGLPWLGLMPGALLKGFRERKTRPQLFFLLSWILMPFLFFSLAKGKLLTYILPCMAPLSILLAAYAKDCAAQTRMKAFKINGVINIVFGVFFILVFLVGMKWMPTFLLYQSQETPKIILGSACALAWASLGAWSLKNNAQNWQYAAACPVLFALLAGYLIPKKLIDTEQPQNFTQNNKALLSGSRYILVNSVGVGAGVAWELNRSNIMMFHQKGELSYGLSYPDSKNKYVSAADFPRWLAQARRKGDVSLMLLLSEGEGTPAHLPKADKIESSHRLILLWYKKTS
ncbi:Undecaprenyl phosphate-alpha-4-amino-4-deoxy-L-arabinose arabinosyl transferase [Candidatus Hamiltonella defensa (Bemisia tabaci)]|uniref:Undecaprenyl phosphate-alpha-4-amino-4-deoxy-L-arabinose arabinosyl transferase n=1 Tax=Candidatus Hamiltonella defensa (Bemisia tabaci) TaxID=672795 RepID=A0A249DXF8_9ENTR|nr:lipid IV(A) 4-amino-4-deoxy-L-arabinosyltransferase [Candidatus Hamiltonella defensa]ASX25945.1 4-amino-4-deoxy-L-arabinose lipid A transferase [Candidatus Hamiltonella defensa (Bemisia tabaci)]CED79432.1 Undecaprenyl phosphate-alpha-4-amino-4-deoxy-L-arabinose arabinosyl transferase [Candidatus Hamiltonella defensa (Bemisia tabaci)]